MTFGPEIRTPLRRYADFSGRSTPREFWWFLVFVALVGTAVISLDLVAADGSVRLGTALAAVWLIAMLVPTLAVAVRSLRDARVVEPEISREMASTSR